MGVHSYVVIQNHCKLWHKNCACFFVVGLYQFEPWQGVGTTNDNVEDDDFLGVDYII